MSRTAGNQVPAALRELLAGERLEESVGLTVLLVTVDIDGWPRLAMLSAGEVLATGPRHLRLALWPNSTSTANLTRGGRATLSLVHGGAGWHVRCSARRSRDLELPGGRLLAGFALTVEEVLEDVVPYAELTAGISFRLVEPERVLAAWREALTALRDG
jgi:hypothetical protein